MPKHNKQVTLLMTDDDADDRKLVQEALNEIFAGHCLDCVKSGNELLDYLHKRNTYADSTAPMPNLILLDLNMPGRDGRSVLKEIKETPFLKHIPIVILTTSNSREDINFCYSAGVNSFIIKPLSFADLSRTVKLLVAYWFQAVELPN